MKLSVSCPNCGEQFRNIKPEMAGKKARCRCGTIVRLGGAETSPGPGSRHPEAPTDLLNVDLMGDEIPSDPLLGGDPADAESNQPIPAEPVVSKPSKTKPAKTKRTKPGSKRRAEQPRSRDNLADDRSIFDQSYSDLDDILAGTGDASPVIARPRPDPGAASSRSSSEPTDSGSTQLRSTKTRSSKRGSSKRRSTVGFLAALGSATLAFWFGIFVAVARFQIVDRMLLSDLSRHLQSVNSATLGNSDVPREFQILFVSLGWVLWGVAVALVVVGVAQFINAWVKLLVDRQPLRRSDGLAATLGVCGLFLMVAMAFAQASFANHQHRLLDAYELPVVAANERLENVSRLRAEIDAPNKAFTTSLLVGATVPLAIFVFSAVRLFTKSPDAPKSRQN